MSKENGFDYDYIVIGSGFGGSVSALRLSEKGYKVAVLEKGKRWQKEDFPKTNWNTRKYMWLPQLGCYGYQMLTQLKHVLIFHGGGVGGGSLVYANQLLVPPDEVFARPEWGIDDCKETMMPHYQEAKRMLGRTLVTKQTGPAGKQVNRIYIEDGSDIEKEFYLSLLVDRQTSRISFVASTEGGMEIEEVAAKTPEKIMKIWFDPVTGRRNAGDAPIPVYPRFEVVDRERNPETQGGQDAAFGG